MDEAELTIAQVIDLYSNMVHGIAMSYLGNSADADDAFSEVFLAYFKRNRTYNDETHRKAWLINTTKNCCKKILYSTWRKKTLPIETIENLEAPFALPEENLVFKALLKLDEKYRIPLYLFYFEQFSTEQIGAYTGRRAGTVRMQLTRGRELMREMLKGEYFDE